MDRHHIQKRGSEVSRLLPRFSADGRGLPPSGNCWASFFRNSFPVSVAFNYSLSPWILTLVVVLLFANVAQTDLFHVLALWPTSDQGVGTRGMRPELLTHIMAPRVLLLLSPLSVETGLYTYPFDNLS